MPLAAVMPPVAWPLSPQHDAAVLHALARRPAALLVELAGVDAPGLAHRLGGVAFTRLDDIDFTRFDVLVTLTWRALSAPVPVVPLWPRVLCVGAGCTGGIPPDAFAASAEAILRAAGLAPQAVAVVATTARRAAEPALQAWAQGLGAGFVACDDATLAAHPGPTRSTYVQARHGLPGIAEAAALATANAGTLLLPRQKARLPGGHHHTLAVARRAEAA
ncbi:cobalamin biosynthesis protein [Rhodopila globiformis]|nr:cobalamin biosynthesis protein [Rhodopila globiformis]